MAKAKKKATKKAASKKSATKKTTAKKATAKKAKGAKRKPNAAFMKKLTVSEALADVIGAGDRARTEVVSAIWKYIKKHDLQDPKNRRNILADEKLKKVFGGKGVVNMFEMTKHVSKHLK
jgi:chromatin remodeling complex protein RSC6